MTEIELLEELKKHIIKRANEEFNFAGCAEFENGCVINTGDDKQLIIKMEVTE